jgi:hypothetical protein
MGAEELDPVVGESALTIAGWATIRPRPAAAITENQTTMIGPKTRPITWVPKRWIANRPARMAIVIGSTIDSRLGSTTSTPSTAERTEIAGVMMPSP